MEEQRTTSHLPLNFLSDERVFIPSFEGELPPDKGFAHIFVRGEQVDLTDLYEDSEPAIIDDVVKEPQSFLSDVFSNIPSDMPEERTDKEIITGKVLGCGTWHGFIEARIGALKRYQQHCNIYGQCEMCRNRVAGEEKLKLRGIVHFKATVKKEEWSALSKRLSRLGIEVRRYPQGEDETTVLLPRKVEGLECRPFRPTQEALAELLEKVGSGRNISGKLGSKRVVVMREREGDGEEPSGQEPGNEAQEERSVMIHQMTIVTDASAEVRKEAWETACEETKDLDPDGDTLQAAVNQRRKAYRKHLRRLGAEIKDGRPMKQRVQISAIAWRENYRKIRTLTKAPDGLKGPLVRLC